MLDFYNHLDLRKSQSELYQNIGSLPQNKSSLNNIISLQIENDKLEEKSSIKLKYNFIYQMLGTY